MFGMSHAQFWNSVIFLNKTFEERLLKKINAVEMRKIEGTGETSVVDIRLLGLNIKLY